MKLSEKDWLKRITAPAVLMWVIPLVLIVPNIILDITDYSNWLDKIVNVALPGGIYIVLISLSRNVGRTSLFMFPFIFYAAIQVVLLYLYGESIIAIDMFLNLATTNVSEATELLGNLSMAIVTVIILYLIPVAWAIVLVVKHRHANIESVRIARRTGIVTLSVSLLSLAACYIFVPRFDILHNVFPVNVIHNNFTAVSRTVATANYYKTSNLYDHRAVSHHPQDMCEVYVLVIGETARADNWQLEGYERPTNPRLSQRPSVVFYKKALSQSNTTHKSMPLILSAVDVETFGDSIYSTKSIVSAFNEVGYNTAFFSNQARNHSFIDFFGREAQTLKFIRDDGVHHYDHELLPLLKNYVENSSGNKIFVILHTYGSHFNYKDRYPQEYEVFKPTNSASADRQNRPQLINAYDNTIVYTDAVLDSIIGILDNLDCNAAMLYLSDHGEDIFDDKRDRFLHASPVPTYSQIHVPVLLWTSDEYNEAYPDVNRIAASHSNDNIASNDVVFHTMLDLAGMTSRKFDKTRSLINKNYHDRPRRYLNDYNEAVPLKASGLRSYDFDMLDENKISYE